ncbi:E1B protein small T-antigen [Barthadenovirus mellis]|uniref:E1B protein small T-antigen n=1 Tax=Passerine adenovirus 1 TaxID=2779174 RepID=A0A7L9DJ89_9ADEN|nr:E1B protein small T-antigen [Passerine adenovirus 1]
MKNLTVEDIAELLFDCCCSGLSLFRHSRITLKPHLWSISSIVCRIAKDRELFSELDKLNKGDALDGAQMFITCCDKPCRLPLVLGMFGWVGSKCRVLGEDQCVDYSRTWDLCYRAANILIVACYFME